MYLSNYKSSYGKCFTKTSSSKNFGKIYKKTSVLASLLKKAPGISIPLGNVRKLEIFGYFQGL